MFFSFPPLLSYWNRWMDCNTIVHCSSTIYNSNRSKKLKNTIDCHNDVNNKNIMDALPKDIMMLILNKLDLVDFHRISAVCKSWQSIAIAAKKIQKHQPQPPWLILSSSEDDHIMCFSLSHDKVFRLELPEIIYGAQCCGSNWGWLIMIGKMGQNFLLDPFTKVVIELPHKATLPDRSEGFFETLINEPNYIRKAMLLSPPATAKNSNWVITIYCCYYLAFCRLGDETWTDFANYDYGFEDIILYNGKLYTINGKCDLILVELEPHPKTRSCNIAPPAEDDFSFYTWQEKSFYLVECLGELLMVVRYRESVQYSFFNQTNMFKIFKLDTEGRCWIKMEDLGVQMLFIGASTGFSLSSLEYPGFRGNCIYFTDDYSTDDYFTDLVVIYHGNTYPRDMGVFHLEDNKIEPFYSNDSHSGVSLPVWFTPISW